jgi:outer membrane protein assembly factor BamB
VIATIRTWRRRMQCVLKILLGVGLMAGVSQFVLAEEPVSGWRGNGAGLWPDATAALQWRRIAKGAMEEMRGQANRPDKSNANTAPLIHKGLPAQWLILGPLSVGDSTKDLDRDLVGGEESLSPNEGDRTSELVWKRFNAKQDDRMEFGAAVLPWVELIKSERFETNRVFYAFTYLYSPRGGPATAVVEHCLGLKVWVNGKQAYRAADRMAPLGTYEPISRYELANSEPPAGHFTADLKPGWNRLLLKLTTSNRDDFKQASFCLRLMDPPDVVYDASNIRWLTELPGRSTSTPIVVGDRIFLAAEPDQLVCIDKTTGRVLWSAANNYFEALTPQERQANPAFATRVDPLVAALRVETDRGRRLELRAKIQTTLTEIDRERFAINADGHFAAHYGIVGFTMPTPVAAGKFVYVWCGLGVAACYDLNGHRQWIRRVPTGPLAYGSSPALADGVLAVYEEKLFGLDAKTGALRWTQPRIRKNIAAIQAATLANQQVFVSQLGEIVRPSDGKLLFRPHSAVAGDGGCWGPPVILGDRIYLGQYGVHHVHIIDFQGVKGDRWQPEITEFDLNLPPELSHNPDGSWLDRSTAGSPLVHRGLMYTVDIYGWLYVADLETKKLVYYKNLNLSGLDGLMHYNAVPVAASPTLIGENLVILDNQGTALVLATGREFKLLARNRIETQLARAWPLPGQETLAYAPPVADRDCLYLRGERFLYCIGVK